MKQNIKKHLNNNLAITRSIEDQIDQMKVDEAKYIINNSYWENAQTIWWCEDHDSLESILDYLFEKLKKYRRGDGLNFRIINEHVVKLDYWIDW